MSVPIYSLGQGKRMQFAKDDSGYWWKRNNWRGRWMAWTPTGSRDRPASIWYDPRAGKANLPCEVQNADPQ